MATERQRKADLAKYVRMMKVISFVAVVVYVLVILASIIESRNMAKIRSVATRTANEAGSKPTDDFFTSYADCFNSKPVYGFTCKYDRRAKVLSFSGEFVAQGWNFTGDLGQAAKWQVDNVLPEIIQSMGPRIRELQAVELLNFLADDVGQTAVWRARLPLSALSPSALQSKDGVKQYVVQYIRVQEDTATGRHLGTQRR